MEIPPLDNFSFVNMIEIIPAIDIIDGQCVRLSQGDYDRKTTYSKEPLEIARRYEDAGVRRLHLVDLDGAKASMPVNLKTLERIASKTSLDVQYGGGIKNAEALRSVFNSGARRAICGSVAVKSPDMFLQWITDFGAGKIILGADIKEGKIAVNGWLETAAQGVEELIDRFVPAGLNQVICTDISRDGMLEGPAFGLYTKLQGEYPAVDITVSGGISSMEDIRRLDKSGLRSVIVGKAIYENKITINELKEWLQNV